MTSRGNKREGRNEATCGPCGMFGQQLSRGEWGARGERERRPWRTFHNADSARQQATSLQASPRLSKRSERKPPNSKPDQLTTLRLIAQPQTFGTRTLARLFEEWSEVGAINNLTSLQAPDTYMKVRACFRTDHLSARPIDDSWMWASAHAAGLPDHPPLQVTHIDVPAMTPSPRSRQPTGSIRRYPCQPAATPMSWSLVPSTNHPPPSFFRLPSCSPLRSLNPKGVAQLCRPPSSPSRPASSRASLAPSGPRRRPRRSSSQWCTTLHPHPQTSHSGPRPYPNPSRRGTRPRATRQQAYARRRRPSMRPSGTPTSTCRARYPP